VVSTLLRFEPLKLTLAVPGPLTIESMLSAWLGRDSRGEPTPEAVAEQRISERREIVGSFVTNGLTVSERAGFRPVGREGYGIRGVRPSERGGPRQRSPFDDHRGGRSSGRFGEPRQRPYREPFRDNERNRRPPFQDPRNPFVTAPRGGRSGPRGTYTSRHEPNRESHRHRQGVAPPIREPRDREYSYGPSRRLAQPPSIVGYSGDDEASTNEGWEDNLHKNLKGASIRYGEPGWGLSFDR